MILSSVDIEYHNYSFHDVHFAYLWHALASRSSQ